MPAETVVRKPVKKKPLNPLWLLASAVLIAAAVMGIVAAVRSLPQSSKCISDECIRNLQFLSQTIHFGVDPCMSFHAYACGLFESPRKTMLAEMNHALATKAYELALEENVNMYPEHMTAQQKAYKLFHKCVDHHSLERKHPEVLIKVLDELKLNPASISDEASEDPVARMIELSLTYGVPALIGFVVDSIIIVKKKRLLKVSVAPEEVLWYKERKVLADKNQLVEYYTSRLKATGAFKSQKDIDTNAATLTALENAATTHLAESAGEDFNKLFNSDTVAIKDMAGYTGPQVNAEKWQRLLGQHGGYGADDRALVQPEGLKFLARLLDKASAEGVRRLLSWSLVRQWAPLVDGSLEKHGPLARNVSCVETVLAVLKLPFLAGVLFKEVAQSRLDDATSLAARIRDTFSGLLGNLSTFPDRAKKQMSDKVNRLKVVIGFPSAVDTPNKVDALYSGLSLSGPTLFENWLEASKFKQAITLKDSKTVMFDATSSEVFYEAMQRQVIVPAAALRSPLLYSPDGALAYNYGSLGQYIASEMARAFAATDKNADYEDEPNPWVTTELHKYYEDINECLKGSWDVIKYDHPRFHSPPSLDSSFELDEVTAFADLVGARMAFEAYLKFGESQKSLSVDPERLSPAAKQFFIGSCIKWCLDRSTKLVNYAGPFRCLLPLVHIPQFSETLRCKRDSQYASMLKCSLQ
ncbi:neprilysin-like [Haemaphysalis longicornis]